MANPPMVRELRLEYHRKTGTVFWSGLRLSTPSVHELNFELLASFLVTRCPKSAMVAALVLACEAIGTDRDAGHPSRGGTPEFRAGMRDLLSELTPRGSDAAAFISCRDRRSLSNSAWRTWVGPTQLSSPHSSLTPKVCRGAFNQVILSIDRFCRTGTVQKPRTTG